MEFTFKSTINEFIRFLKLKNAQIKLMGTEEWSSKSEDMIRPSDWTVIENMVAALQVRFIIPCSSILNQN